MASVTVVIAVLTLVYAVARPPSAAAQDTEAPVAESKQLIQVNPLVLPLSLPVIEFGSSLYYNYGNDGSCPYWCKNAQGSYYCCPSGWPTGNINNPKPGRCPAERPWCPRTRSYAPPHPCNMDHECLGSDKCCYDVCLRQRVCKPALLSF